MKNIIPTLTLKENSYIQYTFFKNQLILSWGCCS